jgi:hypothetical protein
VPDAFAGTQIAAISQRPEKEQRGSFVPDLPIRSRRLDSKNWNRIQGMKKHIPSPYYT